MNQQNYLSVNFTCIGLRFDSFTQHLQLLLVKYKNNNSDWNLLRNDLLPNKTIKDSISEFIKAETCFSVNETQIKLLPPFSNELVKQKISIPSMILFDSNYIWLSPTSKNIEDLQWVNVTLSDKKVLIDTQLDSALLKFVKIALIDLKKDLQLKDYSKLRILLGEKLTLNDFKNCINCVIPNFEKINNSNLMRKINNIIIPLNKFDKNKKGRPSRFYTWK